MAIPGMNTMKRMPTFYLSHGGGPWPWMKDRFGPMFDKLEKSLQELPPSLPERPKAILVISGHWENPEFTLSSSANPPMHYDYTGFPEHTYRIKYPAPGSPELAERVRALLAEGGIVAKLDPERGFDHGTFTVAAVAFPEAEIPIVQLSLRRDYDPAAHIALGRLLAPLRDEGILIIGSGVSFHNFGKLSREGTIPSQQFDSWLQTTLTASSAAEREQRLKHWSDAPAARIAHPREDHLVPLMVAVGAGLDEPGTCVYNDSTMFGSITVSSFRFGLADDSGAARTTV
jgi:aromatic ring-opening dioxygenase catalytic subunit (LigB family)